MLHLFLSLWLCFTKAYKHTYSLFVTVWFITYCNLNKLLNCINYCLWFFLEIENDFELYDVVYCIQLNNDTLLWIKEITLIFILGGYSLKLSMWSNIYPQSTKSNSTFKIVLMQFEEVNFCRSIKNTYFKLIFLTMINKCGTSNHKIVLYLYFY